MMARPLASGLSWMSSLTSLLHRQTAEARAISADTAQLQVSILVVPFAHSLNHTCTHFSRSTNRHCFALPVVIGRARTSPGIQTAAAVYIYRPLPSSHGGFPLKFAVSLRVLVHVHMHQLKSAHAQYSLLTCGVIKMFSLETIYRKHLWILLRQKCRPGKCPHRAVNSRSTREHSHSRKIESCSCTVMIPQPCSQFWEYTITIMIAEKKTDNMTDSELIT